MKKLKSIFNFEQRKTMGEALILYFFSVFSVLIISEYQLLILILGDDILAFFFSRILEISAPIFLSFIILKQAKLGILKKFFIFLSILLTYSFGFFIGMIFLTIISMDINIEKKKTIVKNEVININGVSYKVGSNELIVKVKETGKIQKISKEDWTEIVEICNTDKFEIKYKED